MKRVPQLDGLRGLAILLVLFFHYGWSQLEATPGAISASVTRLFLWTYSGVDLFFVLSGFLITGILLDKSSATNFLKIFYLRRACRILPLYFALILSFVICAHFLVSDPRFEFLFNNQLPLSSYLLFIQNEAMSAANTTGPQWLDVTWSLAVEEQFYILLPLLVYLAPRRWLPWLFGALIISAPLLRCFLPLGGLNTYVSAPWRADSLMAGSLLAWCVRQPHILRHIRANVRQLYWVLAVLLPFLFVISWNGDSRDRAFEHSLYAAFYSALVLVAFVHESSPITRLFSWRPLVWTGTLSYGLYLLHEPISGLVHGFLRGMPPGIFGFTDLAITLLALSLSFVVAIASYHFIERHFITFGHAFAYSHDAEASAAESPEPALDLLPVPVGDERTTARRRVY